MSDYDKLQSALNFNNWKTGECEFECPLCSTIIKGLLQFYKHIKYFHENPNAPDFIKDSTYMTVKQTHKCAICGKVLDHDGYELKQHLKNKHDELGVVAYYEMYVEDCNDVMIVE